MHRTFLALSFALASPLAAQDLTAPEADLLPRVIDSLCIDLVEAHNGCEQVYLIANSQEPDTADLIILTDRRTDPGGEPLAVIRQIAFNGAMWGMSPSLEAGEDGTLLLNSEQTGIGRHPWLQTLRIAYLDEDTGFAGFAIIGYHYTTYDRMSAAGFTCDFDMGSGQVRMETSLMNPETEQTETTEEEYDLAPARMPLHLWQAFQESPGPCGDGLSRFFETQF